MSKLIKNKTFWVGVAGVLTGVVMIIGGDLNNGIIAIGGGIAAITTRDAINKAIK